MVTKAIKKRKRKENGLNYFSSLYTVVFDNLILSTFFEISLKLEFCGYKISIVEKKIKFHSFLSVIILSNGLSANFAGSKKKNSKILGPF